MYEDKEKQQFYNDKVSISANEINKFTYCPYQWYYERKYGVLFLRKKGKGHYAEVDFSTVRNNNFVKGRKFHEQFGRFEKLRRIIMYIIVISIIVAVFLFWLLFVR